MANNTVHRHGLGPVSTVVVHGGPGAAGEMCPVAEELATRMGVLEPWQAALSVDGQVIELAASIAAHANWPVSLIGHSWGAWLVLLTAAARPELVQNVLIVSSGVFDDAYVPLMRQRRRKRLGPELGGEYEELVNRLDGATAVESDRMLSRLGELSAIADAFDPIPPPAWAAPAAGQGAIYEAVWPQAAAMRSNGELLSRVAAVRCPVIGVHGRNDTSPPEGVERPLREVLGDFRFTVLDNCGHTPWLERQARDRFFELLFREVASPTS